MSETMPPNVVATTLDALRERLRDLELDACAIRARVEECRECITLLEHPRRRAVRPRRPTVIKMPDRLEGGLADAEAGLPSLDEVRGILRTPDTGEAA